MIYHLSAINFFPHTSSYKESSVRIEVPLAVRYNSFYFVNNESDLYNVSEIFSALLSTSLLFRLVTF